MAVFTGLVVQKSIIACAAATLSFSGLLLVAGEPESPPSGGAAATPPSTSWQLAECADEHAEKQL